MAAVRDESTAPILIAKNFCPGPVSSLLKISLHLFFTWNIILCHWIQCSCSVWYDYYLVFFGIRYSWLCIWLIEIVSGWSWICVQTQKEAEITLGVKLLDLGNSFLQRIFWKTLAVKWRNQIVFIFNSRWCFWFVASYRLDTKKRWERKSNM